MTELIYNFLDLLFILLLGNLTIAFL